jgi:arginase
MRLAVLGAAFSVGGAHPGCRLGPQVFYGQEYRGLHRRLPLAMRWAGQVRECGSGLQRYPAGAHVVLSSAARLKHRVLQLRQSGTLPIVIGGDHSCAIGTWSGIAAAHQHPVSLLWIDAHLDSHTPETSESHRLHGMPLAALLGEGDSRFTALSGRMPTIRPEYCAVLGVRSFEAAEPLRLKRLGVRFYTQDDIRRRGLPAVLAEAWRHVARAPGGFGVSFDLDVLDPMLAPGVSVPERNGLHPGKLMQLLRQQPCKHRLRALEIVELNPQRDPQGRTRRLLPKLLRALLRAR